MKKRGQITIFLILGIILILVFVMLSYMNSLSKSNIEKNTQSKSEAGDIVKTYAESCLETIGKDALFDIGKHGGYFDPENEAPRWTETLEGNKVPYYFDGIRPTILELSEISIRLAEHIGSQFVECFNKNDFNELGIIVEPIGILDQEIDVSLNEEDVTIKLTHSISLKKAETETIIDSFIVRLPIKIKALYDRASTLVTKTDEKQNDGDKIYNIGGDCRYYDKDGITGVFLYKTGDINIVRFVYYNLRGEKYVQSFIFQFAIWGNNIKGVCTECSVSSQCNAPFPTCDPDGYCIA